MARLTRYVQARVEAGALRPVRDAEVAGRFILETVTTFARHRHRDPDPQPMDDRVVTDTIVDLVVASLVPS
jgi:hypothetical protein